MKLQKMYEWKVRILKWVCFAKKLKVIKSFEILASRRLYKREWRIWLLLVFGEDINYSSFYQIIHKIETKQNQPHLWHKSFVKCSIPIGISYRLLQYPITVLITIFPWLASIKIWCALMSILKTSNVALSKHSQLKTHSSRKGWVKNVCAYLASFFMHNYPKCFYVSVVILCEFHPTLYPSTAPAARFLRKACLRWSIFQCQPYFPKYPQTQSSNRVAFEYFSNCCAVEMKQKIFALSHSWLTRKQTAMVQCTVGMFIVYNQNLCSPRISILLSKCCLDNVRKFFFFLRPWPINTRVEPSAVLASHTNRRHRFLNDLSLKCKTDHFICFQAAELRMASHQSKSIYSYFWSWMASV